MTYHQIFALSAILLLAACSSPDTESLEAKQALLREKQQELDALSKEVATLQAEISDLDSTEVPRDLVTVLPLAKSDFAHFITIQATVEADDLVDATSEISGRVLKLTVEEGDAVIKGQLIATIDIEQLDKQIEEIQTSLDLATTVFERQKRLWDQNIGSEIQYLEAKNNRERLEKSLATLNVQRGKRQVFAPITGSVERVITESGEVTAPGAPIVQILDTGDLKVEADVPENYLRVVKVGDQVGITIPALDLDFRAPVTQIGRTIDPANRTFKVEVDLRSRARGLKPNLLAEMQIRDFALAEAITVPLNRVQQEVNGRRFVFIKADGADGPIARKVYIEIGESSKGQIVVEDGLEGGELLIIDGARNLSDGQPIRVAEQNPVANG